MRIALLSAALAATAFGAIPATAQSTVRGANREYNDQVRDAHSNSRKGAHTRTRCLAHLRHCTQLLGKSPDT